MDPPFKNPGSTPAYVLYHAIRHFRLCRCKSLGAPAEGHFWASREGLPWDRRYLHRSQWAPLQLCPICPTSADGDLPLVVRKDSQGTTCWDCVCLVGSSACPPPQHTHTHLQLYTHTPVCLYICLMCVCVWGAYRDRDMHKPTYVRHVHAHRQTKGQTDRQTDMTIHCCHLAGYVYFKWVNGS